jgi:hypothetical protein
LKVAEDATVRVGAIERGGGQGVDLGAGTGPGMDAHTPSRREDTRPPAWKAGGRQPGENRTNQPDFLMTVDT